MSDIIYNVADYSVCEIGSFCSRAFLLFLKARTSNVHYIQTPLTVVEAMPVSTTSLTYLQQKHNITHSSHQAVARTEHLNNRYRCMPAARRDVWCLWVATLGIPELTMKSPSPLGTRSKTPTVVFYNSYRNRPTCENSTPLGTIRHDAIIRP